MSATEMILATFGDMVTIGNRKGKWAVTQWGNRAASVKFVALNDDGTAKHYATGNKSMDAAKGCTGLFLDAFVVNNPDGTPPTLSTHLPEIVATIRESVEATNQRKSSEASAKGGGSATRKITATQALTEIESLKALFDGEDLAKRIEVVKARVA